MTRIFYANRGHRVGSKKKLYYVRKRRRALRRAGRAFRRRR